MNASLGASLSASGDPAPPPHAREAFLRACWLDVAVRKPGNVSLASAGHGMQAAQFWRSAQAAAGPLLAAGAPVGQRIERAVEATWQAVDCNTNLGILLLCAPLAAAAEVPGACDHPEALRAATEAVLQRLDVADAAAAFRGIARASPGGLGDAPEQDVRAAPSLGLREAMALAADRDRIAWQYANGMADLLGPGLAALPGPAEAAAGGPQGLGAVQPGRPLDAHGAPVAAAAEAAVQRLFLGFLRGHPDSHIVRRHGRAVAQTVLDAAQAWPAPPSPAQARAWADWDEQLKARRLNPGTSADLTVATLFAWGLLQAPWHGT